MTKVLLFIFLFLLSGSIFGQTKSNSGETIADCSGAINLFKSGSYSIQFTGSMGKYAELANYPSLQDVSEQNIVWISYIPEFDGVLNFEASVNQDFLQMIIFEEFANNICVELTNGMAEIKRVYKKKDQKSVGLNKKMGPGQLYPLELMAGQKIMIAFITTEKAKSTMQLNFNFEEYDRVEVAENNTKILDYRNDDFAPYLEITVRDDETDEPIVANITIEGSKELTALYKASDVYFNVSRPGKISIKCDAEGYFFLDKEESVSGISSQHIDLKMSRVGKGKSLQIEEIEFKPGTSEFMTGAEVKLKRIKDFMALNSDVNIEIQGHVFSKGENVYAGQKLSEARAKRVMQYLVDQGIEKNRMEAVGYGNTRPVYPDAKLAYEEQANRRVEIKVK